MKRTLGFIAIVVVLGTLAQPAAAQSERSDVTAVPAMGVVAEARGQYDEAMDLYRKALAIFEELGFRGLVQERLVAAIGPLLGVLATSALFVALHFSLLSAPYLFLFSMYLGWVRTGTRSIYPCMALHFIHNFAVLFYLHGEGP